MASVKSSETQTSLDHPCIAALIKERFVFAGSLFNIGGEAFTPTPLIYQLTTGKDGRMHRGRGDSWMALRFCPICGESLKAQ